MLRVGKEGKVKEVKSSSASRNATQDLNFVLSLDDDEEKLSLENISKEGLKRIIDKVTTLQGDDPRKAYQNLLEIKDRKYHLRNYSSCFVGSEAVDKFLEVSGDLCSSREEAVQLGQKMMDEGLLKHVTEKASFKDGNFFYRFTKEEKSKDSPLNAEVEDSFKPEEGLPASACALSAWLLKSLKRIFKRYAMLVTPETSFGISKTGEFRQFVANVAKYSKLSLSTDLDSEEKKLQFWLNTYHLMLLHAYTESGFQRLGKKGRPAFGFFTGNKYNIGGMLFSLLEIEHAVLRGPMTNPDIFGVSWLFPRFDQSDPRSRFALKEPVPEISLVLSIASASSPPIRIYRSDENIKKNLKEVSQLFLRDSVYEAEGVAVLPKILKWYYRDFGPNVDSMISAVAAYYDNWLDFLTIVQANNNRVTFEYNWDFRIVFAGSLG